MHLHSRENTLVQDVCQSFWRVNISVMKEIASMGMKRLIDLWCVLRRIVVLSRPNDSEHPRKREKERCSGNRPWLKRKKACYDGDSPWIDWDSRTAVSSIMKGFPSRTRLMRAYHSNTRFFRDSLSPFPKEKIREDKGWRRNGLLPTAQRIIPWNLDNLRPLS